MPKNMKSSDKFRIFFDSIFSNALYLSKFHYYLSLKELFSFVFSDTPEPNSWTTLQITWVSTHRLPAVWSRLTLPITFIRPLATGSQAASLWYNRLWPKSWRPIRPCMSWENVFEKAFNCTRPNLQNLICQVRIMENCFRTRLSGLWMTLMSTGNNLIAQWESLDDCLFEVTKVVKFFYCASGRTKMKVIFFVCIW